jgi:tetratricopeptide (TPR) repeat protein
MDDNMSMLHYMPRYILSYLISDLPNHISYLLLMVFITITSPVYSESYVPKSDQSVVASWTVPKPAQQPKIFIAQLLNDASQPGLASRYYGRASALLKPLLAADSNDLELQFYSATVLQHYHQFNKAQQLLSQILQGQSNNVAAWLMKANIHMVQGQLDAAQQACLQILGQGSLFLSTACVLEVSAEHGQVVQSYQQLQNIVKVAGNIPLEQHIWLKQILADLAHRQHLPQQALQHLSGYPLEQAPVSYLALWADIYLAQKQGHIVLETLGPIVEASDSFDDALLLRLTLAEQVTNSINKIWQQRLTQRIEIRLQRNDTAHAADIARYYLDIFPDPVKALHWANINWQQAKLKSDERLLKRAMAAQNIPENTPQV